MFMFYYVDYHVGPCVPMNLLHSYVLLCNVSGGNYVMKLVDVTEPSHRHVCL